VSSGLEGSKSQPPLLAQIADQSTCYQPLVKFWKKLCLTRYNAFLNKLTSNFQYAVSEGHSTSTALTQMTDDWLREIDDIKSVGAVLALNPFTND
jgi:hypothetical protein